MSVTCNVFLALTMGEAVTGVGVDCGLGVCLLGLVQGGSVPFISIFIYAP